MTREAHDRGNRRLALIGLTVALVLGGFLRLRGLGSPGLWVDEAYTVNVALGSARELFAQLRADDAPPLYYLLQAVVLRVLGDSEAAVRTLSVVASLGTIAVLWSWARRYGAAAATFVAFAWAGSSLAVYYAQQARSYALLHLGVAALLHLGSRIRDGRAGDPSEAPTSGRPGEPNESATGSRPSRDEIAFVLVALLLLYAHNLAVWTLLAAFVWVAPTLRGRPRRLGFLAGAFTLGALPWVVTTLGQLGVHAELNAWMGGWWESRPLALGPIFSLGVFSNGTSAWVRPPVPLPSLDPRATLVVYLVWATVIVGLGAVLVRLRRGTPGPWLLLVAPFLGLLATTLFVGPAYVVGRTDTFALVPFVALLGLGWSVGRRSWGPIALGLWLAVGVWLSLTPAPNPKGSDRDLARWIGEELLPGDAVVVSALGRPTLDYSGRRDGWRDRAGEVRAFPAELDRNPAAVYPTPLDSLPSYERQARSLRSRWEQTSTPRVWILATLSDASAQSGAGPRSSSPAGRVRPTVTANDLLYPISVLVYTLRGLEPVPVLREYRQDWVGGERVVLRIPADQFIDLDSLQTIETAP